MNASPEARYVAIAPESPTLRLRASGAHRAEAPTLRLQPPRPPTAPLPRVARGTVPPAAAHSTLDDQLLAILHAPPRATETPTHSFDRKERELGNLFFQLAGHEAESLHRRLVINFACDLVARKFAGLADERKQRLLDFLANHCGH